MLRYSDGGGHSSDQIFDVVVCLKVLLEQPRLAVCVMSALTFCNIFPFLCTKELSTYSHGCICVTTTVVCCNVKQDAADYKEMQQKLLGLTAVYYKML